MKKIVLVRHGESVYNLENRFTGWTDVDLSTNGHEEAKKAGEILKKHDYNFDIAFTSVLKRAIKTLHIILEDLDHLWIPEYKSWHLNERFYGALQGLNKQDTAGKYGFDQVQKWRRDPDEEPPAVDASDDRYPAHDCRYQYLSAEEIPKTENLGDTIARVLPYWNESIVPAISKNEKVIIVAHGNSLRALIKYIDRLSNDEVTALEIPTAKPLVYELDENLQKIRHYYLE
ncbi:2,3-diphosphoglycerate-dependent phosphoglycerate mutase [Pedobacter sp. BMA]|uniref:2,3-diphosphoglycerate-dependent phosphoglycerate mutase n=1 Tax=Pedobacter sp. BMA TaxID=1663685 RepID=UPI00064A075F|nr:2,3-diphosphoglycerate-dependent phosphoglycerate mutase [Pedobacter sp. BMA]KLT66077.1 phosphoglyceromutase [Pedobacter sp. BMA]